MGLNILLITLNCLKFATPFLAATYLVMWIFQIYYPALFKVFDVILGIFPNLINKIFYVVADIGGVEVPMGYVYAALSTIIFTLICTKAIVRVEKLKKIQDNLEIQRRLAAKREIEKRKEQETISRIHQREMFFGLFEFDLEYFNVYNKDPADLVKLQKEYSKIMTEKLQTKYKRVTFVPSNKIFFFSSDFAFFSNLTKDILRLSKIFLRTDSENNIKTNILFSYWADSKNANKKTVAQILSKINKLKHFNKIIISSGIYFKLQEYNTKPWFEIFPLGASKIFNALGNNIDMNIDLYAIIKTK